MDRGAERAQEQGPKLPGTPCKGERASAGADVGAGQRGQLAAVGGTSGTPVDLPNG